MQPDGGLEPALARVLWQHVEPLHAVVYFDAAVAAAVAELGIEGWWAGYVAGRAAPLGRVPAEVVEALFFGFAPGRIRRGVPGAWDRVDPAVLVQRRRSAVAAALEELLGELSTSMTRILELLGSAVAGCEVGGRALFAAHAAVGDPDDPWELFWHRCTLLREHRGDGHVAACVAAGLDGVEVHHLAIARGAVPAGDDQRRNRGWSVQEWAAAAARVSDRGLIGDDASLSPSGRATVDAIELRTDEAATGPIRSLGPAGTHELVELLGPWVDRVESAGLVEHPNPMGVTPRCA